MSLRLSSLLPLVLCGAALTSAGACDKSAATAAPADATDDTDRLTTKLLAELSIGARDAALALCTQSLAADLDERELAILARTLDWLGPVAALERESEDPVEGGVRRRYLARFDRGEVGLTVVVLGDKIEGFELDESEWTALVDRAAEAAAGSLRVIGFRYLDAEGNALDGPLDPASINYELMVEGLDAQLREHHAVIGKTVFDAEGHEVYRQREDDDVRFPQAETGASGGRITGMVAVPGPGRYELELRIRDLVGAQTMTHRESFEVSPSP
ncbi:hypothetical protein [Enhygromyxa salina]|nr:hypothetical protein [Enhygromyxa salina]